MIVIIFNIIVVAAAAQSPIGCVHFMHPSSWSLLSGSFASRQDILAHSYSGLERPEVNCDLLAMYPLHANAAQPAAGPVFMCGAPLCASAVCGYVGASSSERMCLCKSGMCKCVRVQSAWPQRKCVRVYEVEGA